MHLDFLKSDRFWKWVLWTGVGIFLATRTLTLTSFPIFNDEGIYLQYSQLIHEDFGQYKLVSAGLNAYRDWKPPLQYWIGGAFMGLASDPVLAGRLASFFISLFGLWGVYLFSKELLGGKKEASLAVLLYALCPPVLFFNIQFTAETFVFSLAPWMYWFFLRAIRSDKIRLQYALGAAVFGGLVLLSKQSGMVYVLLSILLPLAILKKESKNHKGPKSVWDWKGFWMRVAVVAGGIAAALLFRRLGLSAESVQIEKQFNSRWLMGVQDVLQFPTEIWRTNFRLVRDYYWHYYSAFIFLPILYFFFIAVRKWEMRRMALALGFLGGSTVVLFLLKGFNEYIYNTAIIVFLIPLLAAAFFAAWENLGKAEGRETRKGIRAASVLALVSGVLLLGNWAYQDILMKVSPADYVRRSTPWAIGNYLDNWAGGFGVAEAIASVKEKEGPVLVLADPQWGNPRTALEVYTFGSQDIRVVGLTADFQAPESTQAIKKYILEQGFKTRLAVFSTARNEVRAVWQDNVEKYLCDDRKEIQVEPGQPPIVICSF